MAKKIDAQMAAVKKAIRNNELWIQRALASAYHDEAQAIMSKSQRLVPVDTGTLRRSKFVALPVIKPNDIDQFLGYGAIYARKVHDDIKTKLSKQQVAAIHATGGFDRLKSEVGGPKFLEIPMNAARAGFDDRIARRTRKRWEKRKFAIGGDARSEDQAAAESYRERTQRRFARYKEAEAKAKEAAETFDFGGGI